MSEEMGSTESVSSSNVTSAESHTNGSQSVEASSPPSTAAVAAAPQTLAAKINAKAAAANVVQPPQGAPSPYNPNYKFKVLDQEKEFDAWAKSVIKDAQTEKQVRQLYEKAYGLDFVKNDRTRLKSSLDKVSNEFGAYQKRIGALEGHLQKRDFLSFFEAMKIPEQEVFKWVHERLQFMQKPAHEQQAVNQSRQLQQQVEELKAENNQIQSTAEQYAVNLKEQEMSSYFARPDLATFAQQYEARVGRPGAFRQAVIERGQYHAHMTGKDIPVTQAIHEVLVMLGAYPSQGPVPQTQATPSAQNQVQVSEEEQAPSAPSPKAIATREKPVITNVQGRGATSPVVKKPRSLADLRKIQKESAA